MSREQTSNLISNSQTATNPPHSSYKNASNINKVNIPSASGLFNANENKKFSSTRNCLVCGKAHMLIDCEVFRNKSLEEKKDILRKHALCFCCFYYGHTSNICRKNIKCQKCFRKHSIILCPENHINKSVKGDSLSNSLANKSDSGTVLMQTLRVKLMHKDKSIVIRLLYDTGCQNSYLNKKIIKFMGYLPEACESMTHNLFGGIQETRNHKKYRIMLEDLTGNYRCDFIVYDENKICNDVPSIKNGSWMRRAENLGIKFSDLYTGSQRNADDIDLIIGSDIYGKLLTGKVETLSRGITAIETRLGWTLSGKTFESDDTNSTRNVLNLHVSESQLCDLWRLDTLGILDPSEKESKLEIEKVTENYFRETVKVNSEGRYEVSLPWVKGHAPLSDGRRIAERRLKSCIDSLRKSGNIRDYESVFEEWLEEGIIEVVGPSPEPETEFFLPHRAVIKENSTTRVRPVFDGSAREKGTPSINECLMTGPNLVELIPTIINRFRLRKIGVTADIKKAFLQISLNEKDRPFLRFLWGKGGNLNEKITYQHRRVVFGLTTSPFLLGATLQYHLSNTPDSLKDTAKKLSESFYIDNCLTSVDNEEQLTKFMSESIDILSTAKFDLRGWEHNNPGKLLTEKESTLESKTVPVLGLKWKLDSDILSVDVPDFPRDDKPITKRYILSEVHKIFDPIGFTCPVTLLPKILLQQLWKSKVSWDSELPAQTVKKFERWRNQISVLNSIAIPRCTSDGLTDSDNLSLHVFCDASQVAYATCIFLRNESDSSTTCSLVQARSRVAPLKTTTIPRLELLACTIGTRLSQKVIEDLNFENLKTFYWTDSSNALYWIKGSENWSPFIYNRVQEIRKYSDPENWFLVPGALNPADLPSRGCSAETLKNSRWWEGPRWLRDPPEFWPKSEFNPDYSIVNSEKRKTVRTLIDVSKPALDFLQKISSYLKMLKIVGWIYRFYNNVKKGKDERNFEKFLSADEINDAETVLLRYAQRSLSCDSNSGYNIPTFKDDKGITRVKTRISMRDDLYSFRYPILLNDNYITSSLIYYYHCENQHAGIQTLMSLLREKYWILKSRKAVRSVVNNCQTCKRFRVKPTQTVSAPLPEDRVKEAAVFEITGLDVCGPLYLRDNSKLWIVLFTCAVFRVIHLELITSLSAECFILALRRFIARRGRPSVIISDNGRNFVKTSVELKSVNWDHIKEFAAVQRINWRHNPPSAPWWGGFFERLIGMVKTILRKILGRASLNYEELFTILCDAESTINSRPLTYISEDDTLVPLTPAMFIQDITDTRVPDLDLLESQRFKRRLLYKQKLQEDLRKRFRIEYLGQLSGFSKVNKESSIKEGDIVLIGEESSKRINWPLGRILKLFPGKDGKVRVAAVFFNNKTLIRPLRKIYNLEINNSMFSSRLGDRLSLPPVTESHATPGGSSSDPVHAVSPLAAPGCSSSDPVHAGSPLTTPGCSSADPARALSPECLTGHVPSTLVQTVPLPSPRVPTERPVGSRASNPIPPEFSTMDDSQTKPPQSRYGRRRRVPERLKYTF